LLSHATTVEAIIGYKIDWQTVVQAFINGFQSALNIEFTREDLSDSEKMRAEQLVHEKYCHSSWLDRQKKFR
jgi:lipoate-protein ligase A